MMYLLSKLLKITVQNLRLRFGGPLVVSDLDGFEVLEDSTMQRLLCTSEDFGVPQCPHYRRRCRIRAPCCNEIFDCRHCHNEAKNGINVDQKHRHDIPRHLVQQVICSLCGTEQEVRKICISCGVCMGRYFCETCKLFDDDVSGCSFSYSSFPYVSGESLMQRLG
ncbi:hypothetical protein RHGRI_005398 [Rhododendron griersonianum]|uniref:CHY-type domain-containing protein n=1 Tax=Rhododendron griersonianum TaxID=479676 RepID=A0AAV6LEZ2_9ERIC|nr:hypothetical protein RHGRI_005398 [Rhododendron griersonianum]